MEKFSGQTHGVTHARTDVTHLSVRKFTSRSSKLLQTFQGLLKKAVDINSKMFFCSLAFLGPANFQKTKLIFKVDIAR